MAHFETKWSNVREECEVAISRNKPKYMFFFFKNSVGNSGSNGKVEVMEKRS